MCAGDDLCDGADVLLAARLVVHTGAHQRIDQGDNVNGVVGQVQLAHREKDLLMLGQIKVLRSDKFGQIVKALGIDEDATEQGLLSDEGKGQLAV